MFSKLGYAPHYAEEVIDADGERKLVMADPHLRRSVYIYNLETGRIERGFKIPGNAVANPHVAHLVTDTNPAIGKYWIDVAGTFGFNKGDIVVPDGDNRILIIDRQQNKVKSIPTNVNFLFDVVPSIDGKGLIITDHSSPGQVAKIGPDGNKIWKKPPAIERASRVTLVYAEDLLGGKYHSESFGGRYLVVGHELRGYLYEIDDDGNTKWVCPNDTQRINATWLYRPHSAFRVGLAEYNGNLTIVGLEGGGGFIAVDYDCRPRWGVVKPVAHELKTLPYKFTRYRLLFHGLQQTTHVFPTLNGGIGIVDWRGKNSSQVLEVVGLPSKTTLYWLLAFWYDIGNQWVDFEPTIEIGEWDVVALHIANNGGDTIEYEVLCSIAPQIYYPRYTYGKIVQGGALTQWKTVAKGKVKPNDIEEFKLENNFYSSLLFRARAENENSIITVFVTQKRIS